MQSLDERLPMEKMGLKHHTKNHVQSTRLRTYKSESTAWIPEHTATVRLYGTTDNAIIHAVTVKLTVGRKAALRVIA